MTGVPARPPEKKGAGRGSVELFIIGAINQYSGAAGASPSHLAFEWQACNWPDFAGVVDFGAQSAYKRTTPLGAIQSKEEPDGHEKEADEAPQEIEEARTDQAASSQRILSAEGCDSLRGSVAEAFFRRGANALRGACDASGCGWGDETASSQCREACRQNRDWRSPRKWPGPTNR
jgi:hypothetical protein